MPTDKAVITYQVAGTTKHLNVDGGHVSIQMPDCTIVEVSDVLGGPVSRVHMFRHADHVEVERDA